MRLTILLVVILGGCTPSYKVNEKLSILGVFESNINGEFASSYLDSVQINGAFFGLTKEEEKYFGIENDGGEYFLFNLSEGKVLCKAFFGSDGVIEIEFVCKEINGKWVMIDGYSDEKIIKNTLEEVQRVIESEVIPPIEIALQNRRGNALHPPRTASPSISK